MKVKEESEKAGIKLNVQKTKIMASVPITSWQKKWGNIGDIILGGAPKSLQLVIAAMTFKNAFLGRKAMTNLDSVLKKQRNHFAHKGPYSQSCGFSSSHVWM